MKQIMLIARRDLGAYLHSYFGWIIIALVLLVDGLLFNAWALEGSKTSSEVVTDFFFITFGVLAFACTFIAMPTFAAERERNSIVLLLTAPISEWEMVLGKFLGALGFLGIIMALTIYQPLMVLVHGNLEIGQIFSGYLGLLLVCSLMLAVGIFGSVVSTNQILAVVITGVLIAFFVIGWYLSSVTDPPFDSILAYVSFYDQRFQPFGYGDVHLSTIVYFPTAAFAFLLATARVLQMRRWR